MAGVSDRDPFAPVLGDDIGPTSVERTRSAVALAGFAVALGVAVAAVVGIAALLLWAALSASLK